MVSNEEFYAGWEPVQVNAGGTECEETHEGFGWQVLMLFTIAGTNGGFYINETGLQWSNYPPQRGMGCG